MNIVIDGNAFLNVAVSIVKNILSTNKSIGEKYYVSDLWSTDKFMLKQASKDAFKSFSLNYLGSIFAPFKENISSVFCPCHQASPPMSPSSMSLYLLQLMKMF